jgi:hypothetical protein
MCSKTLPWILEFERDWDSCSTKADIEAIGRIVGYSSGFMLETGLASLLKTQLDSSSMLIHELSELFNGERLAPLLIL